MVKVTYEHTILYKITENSKNDKLYGLNSYHSQLIQVTFPLLMDNKHDFVFKQHVFGLFLIISHQKGDLCFVTPCMYANAQLLLTCVLNANPITVLLI